MIGHARGPGPMSPQQRLRVEETIHQKWDPFRKHGIGGGSAFTWPVVGLAGDGPSPAASRATDASTPPRSSRWAAEMPMRRTHPLRHRRPLGCGPLPKGGAATRTKMKSDAVTAVGIALVDLPLAVEPHPLFRKTRTEMESCAGAPLARLTVTEVDSIRLTGGNYTKRAAVALTGSFHQHLPRLAQCGPWFHARQISTHCAPIGLPGAVSRQPPSLRPVPHGDAYCPRKRQEISHFLLL
jgi:hypothetical protein